MSHLPLIILFQLNVIFYPMEQHCFQLLQSHSGLCMVPDYLQLY